MFASAVVVLIAYIFVGLDGRLDTIAPLFCGTYFGYRMVFENIILTNKFKIDRLA